MPHCLYFPSAPLSDFVEAFCYSDGHEAAVQSLRHLPTGASELIIPLLPTAPYALACGAMSKAFVITSPPRFAFVTVQFKIGGAFPFFGLPADELQNSVVSLTELWGAVVPELTERLLSANHSHTKFKILERFLLRQARIQLQKNPVVTWAIQQLSATENSLSLADVAEQSGYSQRHFINLFRTHVGLTPKGFQRLQRFWFAINKAHYQTEIDWADLALDCGYYDQAHFIHEFQTFAGIAPSTWLSVRGDAPSHILAVT